jgi:hypothetical protein
LKDAKDMEEKVKTAIFGKDLRVELKDYPLSKSGNKIDIVDSGEGYFMPEIGPTNFLDWPSFKRYLFFGPRTYKRIFFALKKASRCVDFGKDESIVYGPDQEQLKKSNLNLLVTKVGKDVNQGTPWYIWIILIFSMLSFFLLLSISGVIR